MLIFSIPAEVSAKALSDQQAAIEANGGIEAVLNSVEIPHTPVPLGQTDSL